MGDKVLIVDDTVVNQKLLAAILRRDGLDPIVAGDGDEGLRKARSEAPELVLLDVMMPGKDGFTVCAELKADAATAEIPVIILSALGETADKVKGLEAGAVDYVTKPFEPGEVMARVRTQLRVRRLNRAMAELNRELLDKQRLLEEDLGAAADIQRALLPRRDLRIPGVDLGWLFSPCATVGGDVFGAMRLDEDHATFWILDVTGHGVPPAMVAVCASQSLSPGAGLVARRSEGDRPMLARPAEVLKALDTEYPMERFDRYFTMSYLLLHIPSGRLLHSTAAHPSPIVLTAAGEMRTLEEGGTIVGMGDGATWDEGETVLQPGDRVFLYTDGVTEYENPAEAQFGRVRFEQALSGSRAVPLGASIEAVDAALKAFGEGRPPVDDVSLLAFEYRG